MKSNKALFVYAELRAFEGNFEIVTGHDCIFPTTKPCTKAEAVRFLCDNAFRTDVRPALYRCGNTMTLELQDIDTEYMLVNIE